VSAAHYRWLGGYELGFCQERIANDLETWSEMPEQEPMSPGQRSLRARMAAHAMHARNDPVEITAKARAAFLASFERAVDPEGVLPPEERRRRAEHLRSAHFARLALASAKARRRRNPAARGGDEPAGQPR
jgi:hypothetical protein